MEQEGPPPEVPRQAGHPPRRRRRPRSWPRGPGGSVRVDAGGPRVEFPRDQSRGRLGDSATVTPSERRLPAQRPSTVHFSPARDWRTSRCPVTPSFPRPSQPAPLMTRSLDAAKAAHLSVPSTLCAFCTCLAGNCVLPFHCPLVWSRRG
jgi:hypothetical protein